MLLRMCAPNLWALFNEFRSTSLNTAISDLISLGGGL